ncbi:glycosyl hydrolases family 31-domain-containing protein [Xylaria bambusicola]|uniref:glycosyl hydrolases family 31-domain-containing protein n=1 Tax=Xylaria bambusicola TaxID=326684 RepID=UPI0020087651|nr:glycosyl hydrolases family 31-domain-containing protein [Xylaria bambusicola]KAI0521082.1 glycosyl hydrolases family 31-domain-containing protein [Xylaria bambusicola]
MMKFLSSLVLASASLALAASIDDCPGYTASNVVESEGKLTADLSLAGTACNIYGTDLTDLKLLVEYQTESRLHVKIYDAGLQVYQIQESVLPRPSGEGVLASDAAIQFQLTEDPVSFSISRTGSGEVLFSTNGSNLIFESQYVNLRTSLPQNPNLYGLGEHSDSFRLSTDNYKRTLWNAESPFIPRNSNLYGSHPNYLEHRGEAGSHGVALLNANGMDININKTDSGDQYLEYNILGGVLDFYFLAGPSPTDVSKQYAEVIGAPAMMSYWTFGFQQCKYGWPDIEFEEGVVANYSAANIPLEALWADIDYMKSRRVFTTDPENYPLDKMRELVDEMHRRGQKYIMMLDPGIAYKDDYATYSRGVEAEAFIKADDGSLYRGTQWAGEVVWPDWFAPKTQDWWTDEILRFFDPETGLDIDGAWNDMNEVSNFCDDVNCDPSQAAASDKRQAPPASHKTLRSRQDSEGDMKGLPDRELFTPAYRINNHQGDLSDKTLYTNNSNADGTVQYDTHNIHGLMMVTATRHALLKRRPNSRPFVLTRSTFAGSGTKAAHWFGDNYSSWDDYRATISQMLSFAAVHAMPMVGSDVCGFNGDAQEKMCARWALLGAFQPFYRNHADISAPNQEFYLWESVTEAARKAIDARYRLLDYIYTAMRRAASTGAPIVNPLFFIYPNDAETFGIDLQWFYGDALLVSPVTDDDATSVTFYLPDDVFYDFWTLQPVKGTGATVTVDDVALTDIPVHIRGGTILPLRSASGNTTALVRQNDFTLVVAPGADGKASGSLYLDDGDSVDVGSEYSEISFTWDGQTLKAEGTFGYATDVVVESVKILGGDQPVTKNGTWSLNEAFEVTVS